MVKFTKWVGLTLSAAMLALTLTGVAAAQEELPPCALDDGTPLSCVLLRMTPETLAGEVWINGFLFNDDPTKYNGFYDYELAAGFSFKLEFRNIEDLTDPNFNLLYVYKDVSQTAVTPPLGQWKVYELKPAKKYIRQAVELACNVKNWAGENVACAVNIDGVDQPDLILPGQADTYALDPGSRTIVLTLTGDPAQTQLWSPASVTKKINAVATATVSKQSFAFSKAGHLIAVMDQPGALADWYVDGALVVEQAAGIDLWVNPAKPHKVEAKNITDDTLDFFSQFMFHWKNATQSPFVGSGQTKTVTFKLVKEGNWAQPFELDIPKGSLAEGPHTYTMAADCASDEEPLFVSDPITFTIDPLAKIVSPVLYLRLIGLRTDKFGGDNLTAVNPQQVLKALVTYSERDKASAASAATDCSVSITLDGVTSSLAPGKVYQLKP